MSVDLSVSIVSWNAREHLERCLGSVFENVGGLDLEVFVVDNDSSDGTADMVGSRFPRVSFIRNPKNVGYGVANNQAFRLCSGRHVLVLNPDTLIRPGSLKGLVDFLDSHESAGVVGPKILNPDGSFQFSCMRNVPTLLSEVFELTRLNRKFPKNRIIGSYYMTYCDPDSEREVSLLSGSCMMLRKTALDSVGGFDEGFFMYAEDMDLCHRVVRTGWQCWYFPGVQIVHVGGQSTKHIPEARLIHSQQGKYEFFRRHFGLRTAVSYRLVTLVTTVAIYIGCVVLFPFSPRATREKLATILRENNCVWRWVFGKNPWCSQQAPG